MEVMMEVMMKVMRVMMEVMMKVMMEVMMEVIVMSCACINKAGSIECESRILVHHHHALASHMSFTSIRLFLITQPTHHHEIPVTLRASPA